MDASDPAPEELDARLGLFGATMVGVGAMVGAGIFVLCGVAMEQAGPGAMLAFALNGVLACVTAFSFAELASAFPESGGGYVFAKKVFPIGGAFAAGWVLGFAYVVAAALYALGFASFVAYGLQTWAGRTVPAGFGPVCAAVTTAGCAWMLARRGAGAGNWISFAKVVAFLVLIVAGAWAFSGTSPGTLERTLTPVLPFGITGVFAAMGFTFIALEGFEIIAAIAEEVRDPVRTVPRAMFLSIGITLVVYMGLIFAVLTVGGEGAESVPWRELGPEGDAAVAIAARRFAGPVGGIVVVVAGLLATFSALAATLLASSRVAYSMARDRALPRSLSVLGGPMSSPVQALLTSTGLVVLVVVATGEVEVAGAAASLIFLISFGLTNAAGLLVRIRAGTLAAWRAPLYPALPLLGITACLALAVFQAVVVPQASIVALAWLVVGAVLYRVSFGRHARTVSARAEAEDATLLTLRGRSQVVLVPIANPERADPLLRLAYGLAAPGVGRVIATSVAPVGERRDDDVDLASATRARDVLDHAARTALAMGRPLEATLLLAEDVLQGIADLAAERRPEVVLLGMSDMRAPEGTALLQEIIDRTPSDIAVLNAPPAWSLEAAKRVLIPVAGRAPHDPLRARLVSMLTRDPSRSVRLLRILGDERQAPAARRVLALQADALGLPSDATTLEVSRRPVEVILKHAAQSDLVLLGFGGAGSRKRLMGRFALEIVGGAPCPVIAIAQARRR